MGNHERLKVKDPLPLDPPVMNASGTLYAEGIPRMLKEREWGALVTKTHTLEPRSGNPPPRWTRLANGGLINNTGLQNPGIDALIQDLGKWDHGLPIIVSVTGANEREMAKMCVRLAEQQSVFGIELNLSCPNTYDFDDYERISVEVKLCKQNLEGSGKMLIVKLPAEHAEDNATTAEAFGADAITLINTVPALTVVGDKKLLGGLSGPPIKEIAMRAVYEAASSVKIPVIGCGGISSELDIQDFMDCGASAVQIGTSRFDPKRDLPEWKPS